MVPLEAMAAQRPVVACASGGPLESIVSGVTGFLVQPTAGAFADAVARLLERGFIKRETHGDDRRRSVLALSAAGFEVYETIAPLVIEMERRLMSVLTEEEEQGLERLITRLAEAGLARMNEA